ncbi:phosphotransferase [Geodermatophilus sp. YIM 151500]|uniref:phosphotransferase n=1 Tax=Geodermatophilus sp. YIM 151500 TaxID=2984531 RepID=UPI0021E4258C|nr:phosphotransferase [Geodermatophilus sp. YIM 151500]MCV2489896.1 phosphotransferase [Geodermatophilus sp. YIM 151500]
MNGRARGAGPGDDGDREVPLPGGVANRGRVVRVGDTVRRPVRSTSPAVHALLGHLEAVGFDGAPRFLGIDAQGREVLSHVPGEAVLPPYPRWAFTDEALTSVARLLRAYHDAVAAFDPSPHAWHAPLPAEFSGGLVSHNDPNLDNVVFRDGRAVALIDFDLAGPGSRLWDVACAARLWAPLRPEATIHDARRGRSLHRLGLFLDGYGADEVDRSRVLAAVEANQAWFCRLVERYVAAGHAAFAEYSKSDVRMQAEQYRRWLADNDAALRDALEP